MPERRFGQLTTRRLAFRRGRTNFWSCVCDCGDSVTVAFPDLLSGRVTSCGCDGCEVPAVPPEHNLSELARRHNIRRTTLWMRIYKLGMPLNEAVSRPVK